nr:RimK-like ATPgrasp N-terminal domain-containing protein [candidate division Zixibacteria bacterium]
MTPKSIKRLARAKANKYLAYYKPEECFVNLAGSYDYLELPYYVSMDLEREGKKIYPTCKEMLDAYVTPLFLEKAKLASLPVPEYYISNGYFEPPVVLDPINPFMVKSRTVIKPGHHETISRSITRNFTYAVCCQEIPPGGEVKHFRSILGWTVSARFREAAVVLWKVFHIPLAKVRVITQPNGNILFSDISQLPIDKLSGRELDYIEEKVTWEE